MIGRGMTPTALKGKRTSQCKYPVSSQKKLQDKLTHQTYLSYAVDIKVNTRIVYVAHPALPLIEDINYGTL
jgi:hypothetical protein